MILYFRKMGRWSYLQERIMVYFVLDYGGGNDAKREVGIVSTCL